MGRFRVILSGEDGQALTEYSFILAFVAMAAILALSQLAAPIVDRLQQVMSSFTPE